MMLLNILFYQMHSEFCNRSTTLLFQFYVSAISAGCLKIDLLAILLFFNSVYFNLKFSDVVLHGANALNAHIVVLL